MHGHRIPRRSDEHACIDWAVLRLLLNVDRQRPLSEAEIARGIVISGQAPDSLKRLRRDDLRQRCNDLAITSYPTVYLNNRGRPAAPRQQAHPGRLLLSSLSGEGPVPERAIRKVFGAKKSRRKLRAANALDRIEFADLIETSRSAGHRNGGRQAP
jgi:hypothetical protein